MLPSLNGPRLKIERARQQINELNSEFREFLTHNRYQIVPTEYDPVRARYNLYVVEGPANRTIRDEWGVVVGEVAHNLRSSLDQLICNLAVLDNPSACGICERTSFPIFRRGPRTRQDRRQVGGRRVAFSFKTNDIKPLTMQHRRLVEEAQPYKRSNHQRGQRLWLLHELNNADKHRLLQVFTARSMGIGYAMLDFDKNWQPASFYRGKPLTHGTLMGWADPRLVRKGEQDRFGVLPEISFWEGCPAAEGRGVVSTLNHLADAVSDTVESFADQF